jgi:predicted enzyme related to lactoylglutathione lyase
MACRLRARRSTISRAARVQARLSKEDTSMLKQAPIHAYVPVQDLDRARTFYEQKLGFSAKSAIEGGIVYESGGGTSFFMYVSGGAGTNQASQAFWVVQDVEAEVAELKAKGVVFEEYDMPEMKTVNGIMTSGPNKAAWFKDTEGNIMAIIQESVP